MLNSSSAYQSVETPHVSTCYCREGRSNVFSLILARLKARPRLLRAWLEDAKRELEAQGVTAQEPSGTGCEDDEDEDEDEGTPAGAGDKGSGVLSNGAAAYAQLEVRHSWGGCSRKPWIRILCS